jgi:ABC-2 type transport system permease protein
MSTLTYTIADSATMLRRSLRHMVRYPSLSLFLVGVPVVVLLLFVYVFGGTLGAGLGHRAGGRADYLQYVLPGILMLGLAGSATNTAISVAMDMTEGIIGRFRTMAISRASVLTGHVIGSVIQTMLAMAVVMGVALLIGFRPAAGLAGLLGALGVLVMTTFAVTWLLLPFLGSGFVPTDSMPAAVRVFADYQPFTPVIETMRGVLMGTPIGSNALLAVAWCAGITLVSYLWARRLYDRDPSR